MFAAPHLVSNCSPLKLPLVYPYAVAVWCHPEAQAAVGWLAAATTTTQMVGGRWWWWWCVEAQGLSLH